MSDLCQNHKDDSWCKHDPDALCGKDSCIMPEQYKKRISVRKGAEGAADGIIAAIAAIASWQIVKAMGDVPTDVQVAVTVSVTGIATGAIRGVRNWWKNRFRERK